MEGSERSVENFGRGGFLAGLAAAVGGDSSEWEELERGRDAAAEFQCGPLVEGEGRGVLEL